jgi:DNA helicase-2/ATP-dependent DNA helicase PcrA
MSSTGEPGEKVIVLDCLSQLEEARAVAERITALLDGKVPSQDIAVLFRSYRHSQLLQDELVRRQIPFIITSSDALFHKPYVKTILAYLHAIAHLQQPIAKGNEALWRLFHYHDSLSTEDTHALGHYLKSHRNLQISDLVFAPPADLIISTHGQEVIARVKERIGMLRQDDHHLPNLVLRIMEYTGLSRQFSNERSVENVEALMHLRDFHGIVDDFTAAHGDDLHRFIEYLELLDELDAPPRAAKHEQADCLRLLSMHAAKGLEFEHVFLLGFYDKKFPLAHGGVEPLIPPMMNPQLRQLFANGNAPTEKELAELKRERKLQEERRLCYVAMTRAKRHLTLSCAKTYHDKDIDVSVFLKELGYSDWRENPSTAGTEHIVYVADIDERAQPPAAEGKIEAFKQQHRKLLLESMDERPKDAVRELMSYMGLAGIPIEELKSLSSLVPEAEIAMEQAKSAANKLTLTFNPNVIEFSFSGLKTFKECPKKFELKNVLRLPSRDEDDPDAPTSVGSFVHDVLEAAVKRQASSLEDLHMIMEELAGTQELDRERCKKILAVFWERNKGKIAGSHEIEKYFSFEEDGIRFHGFIDRIDKLPDGVEIIDYKTGGEPDALSRSWQLSMYACAAERVLGWKAKILTLELLEQEKPRRFEIQADGNATPLDGARTNPFNVNDTMREMVAIAKTALACYTQGFPTTPDDFPCGRCEHKLYCPKWG